MKTTSDGAQDRALVNLGRTFGAVIRSLDEDRPMFQLLRDGEASLVLTCDGVQLLASHEASVDFACRRLVGQLEEWLDEEGAPEES
jgi:hypothetical protein